MTDEDAAAAEADDGTAFEVFARIGPADRALVHVGSVRGHDPFLAWHSAREIYTRRENVTLLWVVPRSAIVSGDEHQGTLGNGLQRDYRLPSYPGRGRRLRAAGGDPV